MGRALALYAAAVVLEYLIDPSLLGLSRWLLARAVTFLLVVLTVAVLFRLIFASGSRVCTTSRQRGLPGSRWPSFRPPFVFTRTWSRTRSWS
jgi:hypothetical protein